MRQTLDNQLALFLRKRRGQTPHDVFARKLGITPSTLIGLENCEQSATLNILQQILDRLQCSLGDIEAREQRIPGGVTLTFQRSVAQVCDEAKLDSDEWTLRFCEGVLHLQERWRDGIEGGLSTEEAQRQVLVSYGDPLAVGKSWRKPWYFRVLFQERYRTTRYLFFLFAYVLFSWLIVLDVHYRFAMDAFDDSDRYQFRRQISSYIYRLMLPFDPSRFDPNDRYPSVRQLISSVNPGYFMNGMGTFLMGLLAMASTMVVRWKPNFKNSRLNHTFVLRYLLALIPLFTIIMLSVWPTYLTWVTFVHSELDVFDQSYCVIHVCAMILGWIGAACLVSELFDLPGMARDRRDHGRPFVVVPSMDEGQI